MVSLSKEQKKRSANTIKVETSTLLRIEKMQKHPRDTWSNIICREMFGTTELESG